MIFTFIPKRHKFRLNKFNLFNLIIHINNIWTC